MVRAWEAWLTSQLLALIWPSSAVGRHLGNTAEDGNSLTHSNKSHEHTFKS